jgi:hypothetical protein
MVVTFMLRPLYSLGKEICTILYEAGRDEKISAPIETRSCMQSVRPSLNALSRPLVLLFSYITYWKLHYGEVLWKEPRCPLDRKLGGN